MAVSAPVAEIEREFALARRSAAPAGTRFALVELEKLFAIYENQVTKDRKTLGVLRDVYLEDLAGVPADLLARGIKAHRTGPRSQFLPKPGEILTPIADELTQRRAAVARLQRMAEIARALPAPAKASMSDDVAARLRETVERLKRAD